MYFWARIDMPALIFGMFASMGQVAVYTTNPLKSRKYEIETCNYLFVIRNGDVSRSAGSH